MTNISGALDLHGLGLTAGADTSARLMPPPPTPDNARQNQYF